MPEDKNKLPVDVLKKILTDFPYRIDGKWYYKKNIHLDGYHFVRCRFDNCRIVTTTGSFLIDHCVFSGGKIFFQGQALKIVKLFNTRATEAQKYWPDLTPTINEDGTFSIRG